MSTLNNIYFDLTSLFTPSECIGCNKLLSDRMQLICVDCYAHMPVTDFHLDPENIVASKLKALNPSVRNATSQFLYINQGRWRSVIHSLKYYHSWQTAFKLGYRYGLDLKESPLYQDIDLVIGVPLHPQRLLKRQYNQSDLIAAGMAKALGVKHNSGALRRVRNNKSQVSVLSAKQRWNNVESLFAVKRANLLEGKHILLVDDVITTGATITACIDAITEALPSVRISVASLAVSSKHVAKV